MASISLIPCAGMSGLSVCQGNHGTVAHTRNKVTQLGQCVSVDQIESDELQLIIGPDPLGKPFYKSWNYKQVVGKLNFLKKSTRVDISYTVHQCSQFMADPKKSHADMVKRIGWFLLLTRDKG